MELWVRSQDKKLLCKIDSLFIEEELYKRKGKYRIMANNGWLGDYNSFERALEVLNDIQDLVNDIADNKIVGCVYEMPEE